MKQWTCTGLVGLALLGAGAIHVVSCSSPGNPNTTNQGGGSCDPCSQNSDCATGYLCNGTTCYSDDQCEDGECNFSSDSVCDPATKICSCSSNVGLCGTCATDLDCRTGLICFHGICSTAPTGFSCTSDSDCANLGPIPAGITPHCAASSCTCAPKSDAADRSGQLSVVTIQSSLTVAKAYFSVVTAYTLATTQLAAGITEQHYNGNLLASPMITNAGAIQFSGGALTATLTPDATGMYASYLDTSNDDVPTGTMVNVTWAGTTDVPAGSGTIQMPDTAMLTAPTIPASGGIVLVRGSTVSFAWTAGSSAIGDMSITITDSATASTSNHVVVSVPLSAGSVDVPIPQDFQAGTGGSLDANATLTSVVTAGSYTITLLGSTGLTVTGGGPFIGSAATIQ
jgi:hypothetical protein